MNHDEVQPWQSAFQQVAMSPLQGKDRLAHLPPVVGKRLQARLSAPYLSPRVRVEAPKQRKALA